MTTRNICPPCRRTPSVLITVLPVGLLLWSHGAFPLRIFSPLLSFPWDLRARFWRLCPLWMELAIVGANVKEINGILDSPELNRPEGKTSLSDEKVCLKQVSFSYGNQDEKVLKGVNLTINPGTVTALVRTIRFRKIHHCKTDRRFLGCNRRKHYPWGKRYQRDPSGSAESGDRLCFPG